MPAPLLALFPLIIKAVATCVCVGGTCYCAKKAHDAYKQGQKTKQKNIDRKSRADEAKIQAALEDNKKVQAEENEWKQKYEEQEKRNKQLENDLENARRKANDPNLSKEEKQHWSNRVVELEEELSKGKNNSKSILDRIKSLGDRIKKNNQIINTAGSGSINDYEDKHWIWQFLTLENILIMLAIYALWKIVRDEQR